MMDTDLFHEYYIHILLLVFSIEHICTVFGSICAKHKLTSKALAGGIGVHALVNNRQVHISAD